VSEQLLAAVAGVLAGGRYNVDLVQVTADFPTEGAGGG
jgi:hypothetical protein